MVDEKEKKKNENDVSEIFASCDFSSLGLHPALCDQMRDRMGYEAPTIIQSQAIPLILSGKHVLVNAATGTGKTLTYLAPLIHQLQNIQPRIQRSSGTFALVLVPTHELCMQVYETLQRLLHRFHWIVPGYIMGGENRSKEKARLRKGISILVATPGRLLDHLKHTESFVHTNLRSIIFDEADRILELGFGKEIEEIIDILGSRHKASEFVRQNVLLSATLNDKVNHLANISLDNPVMIGLDDNKIKPSTKQVTSLESAIERLENSGKVAVTTDGEYKLPAQLNQRYVKVPCGSRLAVLLSVLKNLFTGEASQKIVVFFSTCDAVDFHHALISQFHGLSNSKSETETRELFVKCNILRLHGNMKHEDRVKTFNAFKTEKSALLLSTDVSARGLDFPKVKCIIQYDSPGEATEYVHRVGRTARLGEKGDSLLFLQPIEVDYLEELKKHGVMLTEYPLLKLLDSFPLYGVKQHHVKKFVSLEMHPWVLSLQKSLESFIFTEAKMKKLAHNAFCSWVRAYSAHRGELKSIFMVKKLHLGHVAKSFALKEQPSLVGRSVQKKHTEKRKRDQKTLKVKEGLKKKRMMINEGD
ncbi:P-loop containing nucleoside triphosphate hydrolases superfamily protein [Artemisia annua]|uniref:ATP-dependent RNA helicase n=1 Tax=Artemisia annua TaxID=35608 RepID=A0A2U1QGA2_ARTAN|nr:P-loop containing nucleoside triphosphate hydrolases superfamily protein [Artemisia annua]